MPTATLIRLDLGCGSRKAEGFVGMDAIATEATDVVHDLLDVPWPFAEGSVAECRAFHVVEHLPQACLGCQRKDGLVAFMEEVYRILEPGGTITITGPYYRSIRAWQDPTHTRALTELTFCYFNQPWAKANAVEHYCPSVHFEHVGKVELILNPTWAKNQRRDPYTMAHDWNVIDDMQVVLKAVKPLTTDLSASG
jgi:hypothetical protein